MQLGADDPRRIAEALAPSSEGGKTSSVLRALARVPQATNATSSNERRCRRLAPRRSPRCAGRVRLTSITTS
jgi:hypothetical protein